MRHFIKNETHEEKILGSTRAIIESGCVVKEILLNEEYNRIILSDLPIDIENGDIISILEKNLTNFNKKYIKNIFIDYNIDGNSKGGYIEVNCDENFSEKIISCLNNFQYKNNLIKATKIFQNKTFKRVNLIKISAFWHIWPSKHSGIIEFEDHESANRCLINKPTGYFCSVDKKLDAIITNGFYDKDKFGFVEEKERKFSIFVGDLSEEITEYHLISDFRNYGKIKKCIIFRDKTGFPLGVNLESLKKKITEEFSSINIEFKDIPSNGYETG